jgi:hypothetical protein
VSVTDASNFDANDVALTFGLEAVAQAFEQRRSMLPPFAPYDGDDEDSAPPATIRATAFTWRDEADLPPRRWLYGKHLLRKFLSVDVAAGGVGKSSVKIGEALAMASGRDLYGKEMPEAPLTVWLYNLEDPADETERRIHATAKKFGIRPEEVDGRLYADSGRDQPLVIASEGPDGARIARPVVEAIIAELQARNVDVLVIDPFVSSHQVSENDNVAIDMVAKEWSRIADVCNCSINLVHHLRKQNGAEATAESSRGAVSLIGAARSVIVYNRMSEEEADRAGIDDLERRFIFRTSNDKANLAPPEAADWFRMNNVDLDNGDKVGVACRWQWPNAFAGITEDTLRLVQEEAARGEYREDSRSPDWFGNAIGSIVGKSPHDQREKKQIAAFIREWVKNGILEIETRPDAKRMNRAFIVPGRSVL